MTDHIQNYLAAHPDGIIVLFEMESDLMESNQRLALENISQKVTKEWVKKNFPEENG